MKIALLILLGLAFCLNSWILQMIYPNVSTDWNEYIAFIQMRNRVYETMFAGFFLLTYLISERWMKVLATFFCVLATSSFIDKVFFNITRPLISDIFIIGISFVLAYFVYARELRRA